MGRRRKNPVVFVDQEPESEPELDTLYDMVKYIFNRYISVVY